VEKDLVNELLSALDASVKENVSGKRTAVAFSGGLDSGMIAVLCKRHTDTTLYTAGVKNSYDEKASEEMSKILNMERKYLELSEEILEKELRNMIRITGTINPITLSFEVPLYFVLKYSDENVILSGQGADELFAGYSKYVGLSEKELADAVKDDTLRLMNSTLIHERSVAEHFGKTIVYPYLDERVADVVRGMRKQGISEGDVRKPLLRDAAMMLGQPELAEKPKKSAQYGSGTMVMLRSMAKKKDMTVREMISNMHSETGKE